jgi:hypothetical protein
MKQQSDNSREQFLMPARDMLEIEQPVPETPEQRKNYLLRTRPPWIALLLCFFFSLDILLTIHSIRDIFQNQSIENIILFLIMIFSNILMIALIIIIYRKYQDKRKKKKVHNAGS